MLLESKGRKDTSSLVGIRVLKATKTALESCWEASRTLPRGRQLRIGERKLGEPLNAIPWNNDLRAPPSLGYSSPCKASGNGIQVAISVSSLRYRTLAKLPTPPPPPLPTPTSYQSTSMTLTCPLGTSSCMYVHSKSSKPQHLLRPSPRSRLKGRRDISQHRHLRVAPVPSSAGRDTAGRPSTDELLPVQDRQRRASQGFHSD